MRGGDAEIILSAVSDFGNQLSFEIERQPMHGSLSDLAVKSDHSAVVHYHHDNTRSPVVDEFLFRAQAPGHSKSSSCRVSIEVIPPPARLEFHPKSIDFGEVPLSGRLATNLVMRNSGGKEVSGRLVPPNGFSIVSGEGRFCLKEGENTNIVLEFHPLEEKVFSGQITTIPITSMEDLQLRGLGTPRFRVSQSDPLHWSVKNCSDEEIHLTFTGGVGWIPPKDTLLLPGEEKVFSPTQADDEEAKNHSSAASVIRVSDGLSSRNMDLPPPRRFVPLIVREISDPCLGRIPLGVSVPVSFSLMNRSDHPKSFVWRSSSPAGGGTNSISPIELSGGESRDIQFFWQPSLAGEATLNVQIDEGETVHHDLKWKATVVTTTHIESGNDSTQSMEDGSLEAPQSTVTLPLPSGPPILLLDGVSWTVWKPWFGRDVVLLSWEKGKEEPTRIVVTEKGMVQRKETPAKIHTSEPAAVPSFEVVLFPLATGKVKKQGDREMVDVYGLRPGWHLVSITKLSDKGTPLASSQVTIFIPTPPPWWAIFKIPVAGLLIVVLLLFLKRLRG